MKSCRCEERKKIHIYISLKESFPASSRENFNKYILFCTLIIEKKRETRGENYQRLKEEGYYIESRALCEFSLNINKRNSTPLDPSLFK